MTTPRAHADMAKLYFSDKEMQCWMWIEIDNVWRFDPNPLFLNHKIYHVGKTAPTEPPQIMCELAGVKFPMPVQKRLNLGQEYYVPVPCCPKAPEKDAWDNWSEDEEFLKGNLVQLTREGAIQQARAMAAALEQAIRKAKEQMK